LHIEWDGKLLVEYFWQRTFNNHPEVFVLAQAKNHEDRMAEWLTLQNINDWSDNHKFSGKG